MRKVIFLVTLLANIAALFCAFSPWFRDWAAQGIVFLIFESRFLEVYGALG
ncbi:MAG: hypothetical protein AB1512_18970 [Thermodesulfobacteriota bacterium]